MWVSGICAPTRARHSGCVLVPIEHLVKLRVIHTPPDFLRPQIYTARIQTVENFIHGIVALRVYLLDDDVPDGAKIETRLIIFA